MSMRMLLIIGAIAALNPPVSVTAAEPAAGSPESQAPAIKRTILRRVDVPNSNYEVVLVLVEVPADTSVGRHTHPGTVVGYVIEGEYTMLIDGRAPQALKPGESLDVPSGVVHDEHTGRKPAKLLAVFTVEKGKPLATPVDTKK
jgi:quercetin dioxygenase-like cupin family protein